MTNTGRFGAFAPIVASVIAVLVVSAAVAVHVLVAIGRAAVTDPFLDSAALLVLGVVLGVGVAGGQAQATATTAEVEAHAAHQRLDAIDAPPATIPGPTTPTPTEPLP